MCVWYVCVCSQREAETVYVFVCVYALSRRQRLCVCLCVCVCSLHEAEVHPGVKSLRRKTFLNDNLCDSYLYRVARWHLSSLLIC